MRWDLFQRYRIGAGGTEERSGFDRTLRVVIASVAVKVGGKVEDLTL